MLVKHRGLTVVSAFAMAVAIAVGATVFESVSALLDPALPFPGGDRVVSFKFVGSDAGSPERQVIHEFAALRGQLASVEHFGAHRNAEHNLVAADTAPEPVTVAEITASAFAITATPALLGRYLLPTDEPVSAPPVVVIGLRRVAAPLWGRPQRRGTLDRSRWRAADDCRRHAGRVQVPGRSPVLGSTPRGSAQVRALGGAARSTCSAASRRASRSVRRRRSSRPLHSGPRRCIPRSAGPFGRWSFLTRASTRSIATMVWVLRAGQLLVAALTFVVAINLAILVYARTVTRLGEIAVRSALGASRGRILAQLFIEAFALAIVGAVAGLGLAHYGLDVIQTLSHDRAAACRSGSGSSCRPVR